MGRNIETNIDSVQAQSDLNATTRKLRTTFARLSSGLRIIRATDNVAGLATADHLRADSRVTSVAIRNAHDGISVIGIAGGALSEMTKTFINMAELTEQSAEGHIGDADIVSEAAELTRRNILTRGSTAVTEQANQQPTLALQLLRG